MAILEAIKKLVQNPAVPLVCIAAIIIVVRIVKAGKKKDGKEKDETDIQR